MIESQVMFSHWKDRIRQLKTETFAIYLAAKDPRVPWYAKALIFFVVAHTFSPIDLIPDFIPVLGYLDDLIITPLGIYLALKMIPNEVMVECREQAKLQLEQEGPNQRTAAAVIVAIWVLTGGVLVFSIWRLIGN